MNINMNRHIIMGAFLELAPLVGGEDGAAGRPPTKGREMQVLIKVMMTTITDM